MSKTLRELPEGQDFSPSDFDQSRVFSPSGHQPQVFRKGGHVKPGCYAEGGQVTKNRTANPSTDPTSPQAQADNAAETGWRRSGGYGFKHGGHLPKALRDRKVRKMAQGGRVDGPVPDKGAKTTQQRMREANAARAAATRAMINQRALDADERDRKAAEIMERRAPMTALRKAAETGGVIGGAAGAVQRKAGGGKVKRNYALGGGVGGVLEALSQKTGQQMLPGAQGSAPQAGVTGPLAMIATKLGHLAGQDIAQRLAKPGKMRMPSMKGMAKGGAVKSDASQDRTMVTKGVHQHETAMHKGQKKTPLKLNMGGQVDGGLDPITKLNSGGKVRGKC